MSQPAATETPKEASASVIAQHAATLIAKLTTFQEAVASGKIKASGNAMRLAELMTLMDEFPRMFEIVEPKRTMVS
jgi:alkyl sulfatase BDS1-like metallo-beta-lactamase superfamily hydrolase